MSCRSPVVMADGEWRQAHIARRQPRRPAQTFVLGGRTAGYTPARSAGARCSIYMTMTQRVGQKDRDIVPLPAQYNAASPSETMVAPLTLRTVCSVLFIICGAVVLGISIHIEHAVSAGYFARRALTDDLPSQTRVIGYKSSTFTFDAFVGAFTLFVEILGLIARWVPALSRFVPLPVEGGIALLLWIFLIGESRFLVLKLTTASAINTTQFTEMDRSVCKHLDDLFDLPEFKNVDQQTLRKCPSEVS